MDGGSVSRFAVVIVDACVRRGVGGSPTAVVEDDGTATDVDRRTVPAHAGTSHAAFLGRAPRADGSRPVRFFTTEGELAGCGHGTVAAQAVVLERGGTDELRSRQYTGGRTFEAVAVRRDAGIEVWFDQGIVALRAPAPAERDAIVAALGLTRADLHPDGEVSVASPGTPRLLLPVRDRETLGGISPRFSALASACRRFGQLGCFVYVPPSPTMPAVARMFAPAIGVAEDVANANSTGCLAAHLLTTTGAASVEVEQGDALGRPATVFASARLGPAGIETRVGGLAVIRGRP